MKKNKHKMLYEPEADVFSVEMNSRPIDHAEEAGNIVVHFSKRNEPVLIEILEARRFFSKMGGLVRARKELKKRITVSS